MIPPRLVPLEVDWIQPASTTNSYGDTVTDWSEDAVTSTTINVMIEQKTSTEQRDGRDVTVTTLALFTNELAVDAAHRIVWDGRTYEIEGEPAVIQTPRGPHHLEATIRIVEG